VNEEGNQVPERSYWAFLSYRHTDNRQQDREWASWLHTQIEHYDVPADLIGKRNKFGAFIPERIFPVFRDEEELPADSSLRASIHSALDKASTLIILCSPRAVESRYVAEEISYFIGLGKGERVISAILAGEPGDPDNECFPAPLRQLTAGRMEHASKESSQPLAADFRLANGEEGFTSPEAYRHRLDRESSLSRKQVERVADAYEQKCQLAKLKVIAGVLGIGLDDLRERDKAFRLEREKHKARVLRRWLVAVIALALIAVGAGFLANSLRIESERARADAEDLIAFLQGDAQATLLQVGRLDLMEKLNQAVFHYLDKNRDSTSGLRHRVNSRAEHDQATLFIRVGRTGEAKELLQQAAANSKAAARLQRRDNWLDIAAIALYKYAEILYKEGDYEQATPYLDEVGRLADQVLDLEPGNPYALTAHYGRITILAQIKAEEGLHDEALSSLYALDTWFESRRADHGGKAELDHVIIMTRASRLAKAAGRNHDALATATRALELSEDVEPGEQHDLAGVLARLQVAAIHELSGNYSKSAANLEEAMVTVRRRLGIDPKSREWTEWAIQASRALAAARATGDEYEKALQQSNAVITYARRLHRIDSTSAAGIQALVDSLLDEARFVMRAQYPSEVVARDNARELVTEAQETLRFAHNADIPSDPPNTWSEQLDHLKQLTQEFHAHDTLP
jgi:tetratricopeptide (TPR) repeat protein